jgi:anaerobic selenocysteine-containing dehydrogenase
VNKFLERVYAPDRLLYPVKRIGPKGPGARFARISWEEAITAISAKMQEAIATHGPQAILPYSYRGNNGVYQSNAIDRRFFHALGASTLARTICAGGLYGALAYSDVFQGYAPEGLVESKLIIFWASNPLNTGLHVWPFVQEAKRRGAQLMTIDPYCSRTARVCDEHLFLRPGTDAALALAMMKVIEEERLTDADYIPLHRRYEQFAERLHAYRSTISRTQTSSAQDWNSPMPTQRPSPQRSAWDWHSTVRRRGRAAVRRSLVSRTNRSLAQWAAACVFLGRHVYGARYGEGDAPTSHRLTPGKSTWCDWRSICSILRSPPIAKLYNLQPLRLSARSAGITSRLQRPDLFMVVHDSFTDSTDYGYRFACDNRP